MEHASGVPDQVQRRNDCLVGVVIRLFSAAVVGCVAILGVIAAAAQISPGPLSRAHQSLDGTAQCSTCHKFGGGEAAFKCLDCHGEIASRINARRGAHASFMKQAGSSQDCARCHSEHNGREFPLIKWDPAKFDHRQAGYLLEGKHAGPSCEKCHTAQHISPAERSAIKTKDFSRTFLGLSPNCITCHEDAHKGRLGPNCAQCHNFQDWNNVASKFDHSKTRYPLTGLHAQVKCEKCHTSDAGGKARFAGIPFAKCNDCHSDPHKGTFQQSCQSCHNTSGWKKVLASQLGSSFDHSKTKFPLLGKHQMVNCGQCHWNGDFKRPIVFGKCMDCHKPDPHQGQFAKRAGGAECAACHSVDGWKPSKFTVQNHAATLYPLQGKHAALECAQCHIPKGKDTQFKIKFQRCIDCHRDEHQGQFAAAPHWNKCEDCHTLQGYKPSTFSLARHKETRFVLTGGHLAIPCVECHNNSAEMKPSIKTDAVYHFDDLSCTRCHQNPHRDQFKKRMELLGSDGKQLGCAACHTTKSWKELSKFDHAQTSFPLMGAHRAVACIDCHKPSNLETKLLNVDFTSAPTKCEECHSDVHGRQFANASKITPCAECHNTAKWKPSTFDHDLRASFQLQGAHKRVRCNDCHKLTKIIDEKPVLFYKPTPKDCAACHAPDVASRPLGF